MDCSTDGENFELFDIAIKNTPPHIGVPWPTVEGRKLSSTDRDTINIDVLKWTCENFEGQKPKSCENYTKALSGFKD